MGKVGNVVALKMYVFQMLSALVHCHDGASNCLSTTIQVFFTKSRLLHASDYCIKIGHCPLCTTPRRQRNDGNALGYVPKLPRLLWS